MYLEKYNQADAQAALDRALAINGRAAEIHRPRGMTSDGTSLYATRELATQISEEIRLLSRYTAVQTVTVFGGVSTLRQVQALRRGAEIVVAPCANCKKQLKELVEYYELPCRVMGLHDLILQHDQRFKRLIGGVLALISLTGLWQWYAAGI